MTNGEFIIDLLFKGCPISASREEIEECYKIFNKKDWVDFCSQMGDYDHPSERVEGERVMNEELKQFNKYGISEFVKKELYGDGTIGKFYSKNFHEMNEEYSEEDS